MSGTHTHAQVLEREANLTPFWEERFMKVPAFRPEPEPDAVRAAAHIRPALEKAIASSSPAVVEVISDVDAMARRAWRP